MLAPRRGDDEINQRSKHDPPLSSLESCWVCVFAARLCGANSPGEAGLFHCSDVNVNICRKLRKTLFTHGYHYVKLARAVASKCFKPSIGRTISYCCLPILYLSPFSHHPSKTLSERVYVPRWSWALDKPCSSTSSPAPGGIHTCFSF